MKILLAVLITSCSIFGQSGKQQALMLANPPAGGGGGVPTRVGGTSCSSQTNTTSFTCNYTATTGNTLIVGDSHYNNLITTATVTDSASNTYASDFIKAVQGAGLYGASMSHAFNVTGGALTITVTWDAASNGREIFIEEYSGLTAVDVAAVSDNGAVGGSAASGNLATMTANALIVGVGVTAAIGNPCAFTGASSFTVRQSQLDGSGRICSGLLDQIVSSTGTYNVTATIDGATAWAMGGVALK